MSSDCFSGVRSWIDIFRCQLGGLESRVCFVQEPRRLIDGVGLGRLRRVV